MPVIAPHRRHHAAPTRGCQHPRHEISLADLAAPMKADYDELANVIATSGMALQ
ncbi:hypothetical protein [Bradyrhizobium murdochi]|uniref:hypothetical protein n=1 Tax=Bradyrhizobium murdochi TaxID=1038859 RepID=UPI0012EC4200|nr:hypothetical protein [Bradyrhizobium murdochi]